MNLENYFRRQAQRAAGLSPPTLKLLRGAMDLIFGFLPLELKSWLDAALAKDHLYASPPLTSPLWLIIDVGTSLA